MDPGVLIAYKKQKKKKKHIGRGVMKNSYSIVYKSTEAEGITCLVVPHPVEHDLRRSIPPSSHITRHFIHGLSCKPKVKNLNKPIKII